MNRFLFFLGLMLALGTGVQAQYNRYAYLVEFTDKQNSAYSTSRPLEFLSQRAIDRKNNYQITIDETDFPVNQNYIDSVLKLGGIYHNQSRWFNSAVFFTDTTLFADHAASLSFVKKVSLIFVNYGFKSANKLNDTYSSNAVTFSSGLNYGASQKQITMFNAQYLHQKGYRGQGLHIAVLDGGFYNAHSLSCFDSLFQNGRILGTYDFVNKNTNVYDDITHGTSVLSVLAANLPNQLVGSAPEASYWLLRTENGATEFPIEEENWITGAEFADSVGADMLSVSLGYSVFDNPELNHEYADMDGQTTRVSRGAEMAYEKGMLVVNSAGNEGNNGWGYITAPSDGEHVLCIGAIDTLGNIAPFSSRGPSSDGRIKPDVVGVGLSTALVNGQGDIVYGNGTSFSCPLIAGMAACLWQTNRQATPAEIMEAIKKSSSKFYWPDTDYGYGLPDFAKAYAWLNVMNDTDAVSISDVRIYPNPAVNAISIDLITQFDQTVQVRLFNISGRELVNQQFRSEQNQAHCLKIASLDELPTGIYLVSVVANNNTFTQKIAVE